MRINVKFSSAREDAAQAAATAEKAAIAGNRLHYLIRRTRSNTGARSGARRKSTRTRGI
jgi:hypothetical protein